MSPDAARLPELLLRLDACAWRLDQEQLVPLEELDALAEAATALGVALGADELLQLTARLDHVMSAIDANASRIKAKLARVGHGRRAVRGYATLSTAPGTP